MKVESVEEFKARGGKVKVLPSRRENDPRKVPPQFEIKNPKSFVMRGVK